MTDRRVLLVAALAAAGCMRIYPDPELPDLIVEWPPLCDDGAVTVRLEAAAADGTRLEQDVACGAGEGRIEDLDREAHTVTASLLDDAGAVLGRTAPTEVDLRAGFSRRAYLSDFARDAAFITAAWAFTGGDSCGSLGATDVAVELISDDDGASFGAPCEAGTLGYLAPVPAGTYTVLVRAQGGAELAPVAASEPRAGVVIPSRGELVDLGTFALTRCTSSCPTLPGAE